MRNAQPRPAIPPGPYVWHEFLTEDEAPIYKQEAVAALRNWQPDPDDPEAPPVISAILLSLRIAEYRNLISKARKGEVQTEEWKPAGHNPVVWELRMDYGEDHFRFYFSEPQNYPWTVVALVAQHKDVSLPDSEIEAIQTAHIKRASDRHNLGVLWKWGIEAVSERPRIQLDQVPPKI
jgi:hypothetical protein